MPIPVTPIPAGLQLRRQMAARFGDDLDAPLDEPLALPIGLEGFERLVAEDVADAPDSFEDIREAGQMRFGDH